MMYLAPSVTASDDCKDAVNTVLFGARGVRGIVGVEGLYDMPQLVSRWPDYRDFVAQALGEQPSAWRAASPIFFGKALNSEASRAAAPRFLIVHSLEDELYIA
ncbi:hypothetical protein THASP1DRAFT_33758 [Thamnocephalis sphaerospora]|uniref:Alpha/Beta hydrolase protein n=1 Tax=Thamnocephalis sphaerospora TaxID=78915 RepID=A0A4P9XFV8_9FUNG|nr:hypothetical protein THASP1DRAFT_33758 [Thamnocephalis sphaerospora]|eukprot:RKP04474.1 hypothetical protein THASP1DRAFT_33758 [Thamnocephalis sphaerospora]